MKKIKTQEPVKVVIKTDEPKQDAMQHAKFVKYSHEEINFSFENKYKEHKSKILELVVSRMAMESVLEELESSMGTFMNGTPIELRENGTTETLDSIFDKALATYAVNHSLEIILGDNLELKQEYIENMFGSKPSGVIKKTVIPIPGPVVRSRDPDAVSTEIEKIERQIFHGEKPEVPNSPYGNFSKDKKDTKLPVVGKTKRGRRRR